ncbi:flagellar hook-length control protein FliK, partial [Demequina mangrovi]
VTGGLADSAGDAATDAETPVPEHPVDPTLDLDPDAAEAEAVADRLRAGGDRPGEALPAASTDAVRPQAGRSGEGAVPMAVTAAEATSPAQPAAASSTATPAREVPVATQLAAPLASLRQLPQGEHELQLSITPETFGPVRVVARITPDGVSLQLFGSTDAGREALRAALPDLRRDLEATGLSADLDLAEDGASGQDAWNDDREGAGASTLAWPGTTIGGSPAADHPTPTPLDTRAGGVDLLL